MKLCFLHVVFTLGLRALVDDFQLLDHIFDLRNRAFKEALERWGERRKENRLVETEVVAFLLEFEADLPLLLGEVFLYHC